MKRLCWLSPLLLLSFALGQSQTQEIPGVFRGQTIQVTSGIQLDPTKDLIKLTLTPAQPLADTCKRDIDIGGTASNSFSIRIPLDACIGRYDLSATKNSDPKSINITSAQTIQVNERPPEVTGIDPTVIYNNGSGAHPSWKVVFLGPSSLKTGQPYALRFKDHSLPKCAPPASGNQQPQQTPNPPQPGASSPTQSDVPDPKDSDTPCFKQLDSKPDTTDGQIAFLVGGKDFLSTFHGKQLVWLELNGATSAAQEIHIVDASRNTPRNYAIGITAALLVLIYVLLSSGGPSMLTTPMGRTSLLSKLFMDEETKSYSLSKCQFFAWTFAAILGYIFLAVSKSVVQGSAVFPDIPDGLPGIILYSAATSVLATGITTTRGSKGAGEEHPNLSDFITTGGVVAPERLQFVVWTVTGIFTFLTIVFKSDPMTLSDLPRIPDGFMNLMGISSAGYLAGKLARKPGPVIKGIKVGTLGDANPPTQLPLIVTGENLDPNCKIKIDGQPIRDSLYTVAGTADPQSKFAKELTITITDAATTADFVVGSHRLTVVNSDAQAADTTFPADAMTATPITGVQRSNQLTEVVVSGDNFAEGTRAIWKNPAGVVSAVIDPLGAAAALPPQAAGVKFRTAKSLSVWLVPGQEAGKGELTLISPTGLRTRTTVEVV